MVGHSHLGLASFCHGKKKKGRQKVCGDCICCHWTEHAIGCLCITVSLFTSQSHSATLNKNTYASSASDVQLGLDFTDPSPIKHGFVGLISPSPKPKHTHFGFCHCGPHSGINAVEGAHDPSLRRGYAHTTVSTGTEHIQTEGEQIVKARASTTKCCWLSWLQ